jgi:hypothetical protein
MKRKIIIKKFLKIFKLTIWIENFFFDFLLGIYFYKWAIEFQICFLWFDTYFIIGKIK